MTKARAPRRLAREERTIAGMIVMYCRDHHGEQVMHDADGFCVDCAQLMAYARLRL